MKKTDGDVQFFKQVLEEQGFAVLPKDELALLTWDGYIAQFFIFAQLGYTYKDSWQMTEDKLFALFGINRYTSASSMRSALMRMRRSKKFK